MKLYNKENRKQKKFVPIKPGMDVQLTSPRNKEIVALGTVQAEKGNYLDVTINLVMQCTARLPKPKGRIKLMRDAQSRTISWPKECVSLFN